MSDATPRHYMAIAEMIDHESYVLKRTAGEHKLTVAAQLRRLADILEQKI